MFGIFERTKSNQDLYSTDFKKKMTEKNVVVLDVRTAGEFSTGRIPGAINVDLMCSDFVSQVSKLDKNKTYLVYCRSGSRSARACQILSSKGVKAFNLAGGITGWPDELV